PRSPSFFAAALRSPSSSLPSCSINFSQLAGTGAGGAAAKAAKANEARKNAEAAVLRTAFTLSGRGLTLYRRAAGRGGLAADRRPSASRRIRVTLHREDRRRPRNFVGRAHSSREPLVPIDQRIRHRKAAWQSGPPFTA